MAWRDKSNPWGRRTSRTASGRRLDDPEAGRGRGVTPYTNAQSMSTSGADAQNSEPTSSRVLSEKELTSEPQQLDAQASKGGSHIRNRIPFLHKKENEGELEHRSSETSKAGKQKFTLWGQLQATVFGSYINVLLVCVPVGIALNYTNVNRIAVFVINFLGIVPLAGLLSYATEELAMRVGETLGGLLNASFGNAVELIVSIIALVQNEILIVKTSLIGSMLGNLLLVMGMCFFFGGLRRTEQHFNVTVAQTAASLLALAVGSLVIPTVYLQWGTNNPNDINARNLGVAPLSRATAVILLLVYGCYLFFQLKTHVKMYNEPSQKVPINRSHKKGAAEQGIATIGAGTAAAGNGLLNDGENNVFKQDGNIDNGDDEDKDEPKLSIWGAVITLCASTALVGLCAEFMVSSISALTQTGNISPEFVGLILIPIVGNVAEHATAVTVSIKDKMDLAIGVAVGSSLQVSLFVLPFIVVLGWIMNKPAMDLNFDGFLIATLFISVLLVNYLIQDGKSHWLEGVLLQAIYLIIAVAAWYYPASLDVVG